MSRTIDLLHKPISSRSKKHPPVLIVPVAFEWFADQAQMGIGGTLVYLANGRKRSARLSLTGAALALILEELAPNGAVPDEREVMSKILTHWGCEQLSDLATLRERRPPIDLVLNLK